MITTPQARFILEDGDDSTTTRVFVFPVYDKDDVIVRRIDADGALSAPMTEGVDYEITLTAAPASGGPYPGGTIEFTTAAASDEKDYAYSSTPIVQNVKVTTTTTTYNMGLERNALDPIVFMVQELNDRIGRVAGIDNPSYNFPIFPDPAGNNGKVMYVADDVYTLVDIFDGSEIFLSNAAAGRLAMFSGADSLDGLPNVTYVDATKTLKVKGSAVITDKSLKLLNSSDVVVGSFRSDGQIIDDTDLTTKLYVDDAIDVAISGVDPGGVVLPVTWSAASVSPIVTVNQETLGEIVLRLSSTGGGIEDVMQGSVTTASTATVNVFAFGTETDKAYLLEAVVVGFNTSGKAFGIRHSALFKNVAGTVTVVGSAQYPDPFGPKEDMTGTPEVHFAINGTGLAVTVTPGNSTSTKWDCTLRRYTRSMA